MSKKDNRSQDSDGAGQPEQQTLSGETAEISYEESDSSEGAKVRRVMRKYDMNDVGRKLEHKYTRLGRRRSLRELENEFNKKVLDHATREAHISESEYRDCIQHLHHDELRLTREQLDRLGVDGEEVLNDMVTHETIRNYLMNYRGVTVNKSYVTTDGSAETVNRLHKRLKQVLADIMERHHKRDEIPASPDVDTSVKVVCPDCENTVSAVKYLQLSTCPNCSVESAEGDGIESL